MILFSGIGLIYSCGNESEAISNSKLKIEEIQNTEHNDLVLDGDKLWIANAETTSGIENMMNIMNSFTEKEEVSAYKPLTDSLRVEFSMIFQKCTMKGEAHNQLHNFLLPIKALFETLSSNDLEQCRESFFNLNSHLKKYKNYFK